jgi:hypothetical protein
MVCGEQKGVPSTRCRATTSHQQCHSPSHSSPAVGKSHWGMPAEEQPAPFEAAAGRPHYALVSHGHTATNELEVKTQSQQQALVIGIELRVTRSQLFLSVSISRNAPVWSLMTRKADPNPKRACTITNPAHPNCPVIPKLSNPNPSSLSNHEPTLPPLPKSMTEPKAE